jgi:hypothetical protein
LRVPGLAGAFAHTPIDLRARAGLSIRAIRIHRVKRVGDRQDTRQQGNLPAGKPIGIAEPVVAFVVMAHDGTKVF